MTDQQPISIEPDLLSSKSHRDTPVTMASLDAVRAEYFAANPDALIWEVVLVDNTGRPNNAPVVDMSSGNYLMNRLSRISS